jgi:DtxR family manganese transport transcriptional regulator
VYQFLVAIGVSEANAAVDAEGIEHHVGSETLARLKEYAAKLKGKPPRKISERPAGSA